MTEGGNILDVDTEVQRLLLGLKTGDFCTVAYQRRALACEAALIGKQTQTVRPRARTLVRALLNPAWSAMLLYRVAIMAQAKGWNMVASLLCRLNLALNGCDIHRDARLAAPLFLRHPAGVVIGAGVIMEPYCQIHGGCQFVRDPSEFGGNDAYPHFGEGVFLGAGAVVVGGVEIGKHAVIGALACVTQSIPPRAVVAGPRAGVVRQLRSEEKPDLRAKRRP